PVAVLDPQPDLAVQGNVDLPAVEDHLPSGRHEGGEGDALAAVPRRLDLEQRDADLGRGRDRAPEAVRVAAVAVVGLAGQGDLHAGGDVAGDVGLELEADLRVGVPVVLLELLRPGRLERDLRARPAGADVVPAHVPVDRAADGLVRLQAGE